METGLLRDEVPRKDEQQKADEKAKEKDPIVNPAIWNANNKRKKGTKKLGRERTHSKLLFHRKKYYCVKGVTTMPYALLEPHSLMLQVA
jgi:hypothetical protein